MNEVHKVGRKGLAYPGVKHPPCRDPATDILENSHGDDAGGKVVSHSLSAQRGAVTTPTKRCVTHTQNKSRLRMQLVTTESQDPAHFGSGLQAAEDSAYCANW